MLKQKTLQGSFSLCGKGLHTGLNLTVTFNPAPENHGYKIQRIDLDGRPIIDALKFPFWMEARKFTWRTSNV